MHRLEYLLVAVCVLVIAFLSWNSSRNAQALAMGEFERTTEVVTDDLQNRLGVYLQSLNGTAAFLSSSDQVTVADFDNFVSSLDIGHHLPGISGIGFIEPVQPGEEEAFQARMAENGQPNLTIFPKTDGERFVVSRISPLEPNKEALGLDISFEDGRRGAALQSRETGTARLTPRILLVQDDTREPGFLLLRPLYWEDSLPSTKGSLGSGFRGWVYAPFVGRNLLAPLSLGGGYGHAFRVFDGPSKIADHMIFASEDWGGYEGKQRISYDVEVFGRIWTAEFVSSAAFDRAFRSWIPLVIAIVGALLTGLLIFAVRGQSIRSEALSELAAMRTREISTREQENRAVIENAVTAVLILNAEKCVLFANQAAQNYFGYSRQEMTNLNFDDVVTELETPGATFNALGKTRDGGQLILDLQCNAWVTSEGVERITAIVRDLTREHAIQQEVKRTKVLYDLALKGAEIGVFDIDLQTGKSEVSETWFTLMGISPQEGLDTQKVFLSRVHPEDVSILESADAALIEGRSQRSLSEFRMRFPDQKWRWMRSNAVIADWDATGNPTRMIGTQTDVTELRQARDALETSEQRFKQVLSAAPIGMALMDEEGRFAGVNAAFCALVGRDEKSILAGTNLTDLMAKDEIKQIFSGVLDLMQRGQDEIYTAEHQLLTADGEQRWGLFNISWTLDRNTGQNVFIAQINDITDQKQLSRAKDEFVATISHELRTPLTSIKAGLNLIQATDASTLSESSTRLLDIAVSNTDRLTNLVNDILDLEKIASGDANFDFVPTDLRDVISHAIEEMSGLSESHNNTLTLQMPTVPLLVDCDYGRTKQVLVNLISNACKYSDEETEVLVKAEALDGKAIVYVQNTGPGVPERYKPKLFDAFSQADTSDTRAKGGAGLGLNITRQIVGRHGGEIGLESVPNGVTVFWFTYPTAKEEAVKLVDSEPEVPDALAEKPQVLHLESDDDFAEIVQSGLRDFAHITHVRSVARARDALRRGFPDVVLLDWTAPDADVKTLLNEIESADKDVRVVGLSSDVDQPKDTRLLANLEKSRTELSTIARYVSGRVARAS